MLAVALAMDCFTVSITCGLIQRRMGAQVLVMAFFFGLFQGLMPLIGWLTASLFSQQISAFDHWVAFGLLAFLGGKMIWEGCKSKKEDETPRFNPSRLVVILTLAVATSIDALAVGFSFVGMGLLECSQILLPVVAIGVVSFLFSVFGKFIGVRLGHRFDWPAEQLGGVILIIIGIRVLAEHLMA